LKRFADVTDGTSNTVMIGERPAGPNSLEGAWYAGSGLVTCPGAQIRPASPATGFVHGAVDCPYAAPVLRPGRIDNACDVTHFWSLHSGGAHFAFVDGSVRFMGYNQTEIIPLLATRAGGEILPVNW
jgi:prepilin-type processing-associated H-X9-DG protein